MPSIKTHKSAAIILFINENICDFLKIAHSESLGWPNAIYIFPYGTQYHPQMNNRFWLLVYINAI